MNGARILGILELVLLSGFLGNGLSFLRPDQGQGECLCPENLTGATLCALCLGLWGLTPTLTPAVERCYLFQGIHLSLHSNSYLQRFSFYLMEENVNFSLSKYWLLGSRFPFFFMFK